MKNRESDKTYSKYYDCGNEETEITIDDLV